MSIARLINRPCTIRREVEGKAEDSLGDAVTEPVEVETKCELQQVGGFRGEAEGEVSETRWLIFLLPAEEVGTGDSIDVEGAGVFQVFGEPWRARNPRTGQYSHIQVTVRQTAAPGESPGGGS